MQRALLDQTHIVSETLEQLRTVHDSINLDLIEAKKLQQSLVREKHRSFEGADLSFVLHPAGHVGGDLVGYFPVSKTDVGFFAIDVSGHGVKFSPYDGAPCRVSDLPLAGTKHSSHV